MVERGKKESLYARLSTIPFITAIDRQTLTNNFIGKVNADFTFIVSFTSAIVFAALLLAYRKIELALITFIPMFITWVWILGIMALLKIEFNLVNVMVSTFIFGLGDDYSIFTMDGLRKHQANGTALSSVRVSVFVSAVTTVIGLGVLIFAKHPALQSIALISITGIACVWVMSQTLEPFLYEWMVSSRVRRGLKPKTILGMINTFIAYFLFSSGSLILAFIGFVVLRIPFAKNKLKHFYHVLISAFARTLVGWTPNLKRVIVDGKGVFDKPSIIVCNHSSFLDILLTVGLTPKVILLTNKWVWNSPVFGAVVRLAEYYPVDDGAEEGVERLHRKVEEGFSIVIFPEGTRSPDGHLQRFHKGAFYLAEKLGLDIRPLLILGAHEAIPKGDFYINRSTLTLKFLPPIVMEDKTFGTTYQERTKAISRYFKDEFATHQEAPKNVN
jgi:1-acyl-sn-glycerol-3-phosphate acyltransferase